jgi:hypothetical protein
MASFIATKGGHWRITVILRVGGRVLNSPVFPDLDAAYHNLAVIRQAQESGELINLPWLSAYGHEVTAAFLEEADLPIPY